MSVPVRAQQESRTTVSYGIRNSLEEMDLSYFGGELGKSGSGKGS